MNYYENKSYNMKTICKFINMPYKIKISQFNVILKNRNKV